MKKNNSWFTLIELIVSITILSIIVWSVFTVFAMQADLNNKIDISRAMQENVKNIIFTFKEDIRINSLSWVNNDLTYSNCNLDSNIKYNSWTKLCLNNWVSYYLWFFDTNNNIVRVSDKNICKSWKDSCFLVKEISWEKNILSNSWVQFVDLNFLLSSEDMKKVIISFSLKPSIKKWIKSDLIENTILNFQTTITTRLYQK